MNFRATRSRRSAPDLDLTPLIDVVFLLLIFFLVTASFSNDQQAVVPLDLPEGTTGNTAEAGARIDVYVETDGLATLDTHSGPPLRGLDAAELEEALRSLQATSATTPVYLRGDRGASYGTVMTLLDVARRVGFRRVYNVVSQPR